MSDSRVARQLAGKLPVVALLSLSPPSLAQNVVSYDIVDGREISESLTGQPGDPDAGQQLYLDQQLTRCSGCHGSPDGAEDERAEGAPSLAGVAERLPEGAIRMWLIAPEVLKPGTRMPSYYRVGQRDDPADPRYGETLLTAGEIEDLVAYLLRQAQGR